MPVQAAVPLLLNASVHRVLISVVRPSLSLHLTPTLVDVYAFRALRSLCRSLSDSKVGPGRT
jgi:hypothetical protein